MNCPTRGETLNSTFFKQVRAESIKKKHLGIGELFAGIKYFHVPPVSKPEGRANA